MGWISKAWNRIRGAAPVDMTYIPQVDAPAGFPGAGDPIAADECYLELYLESCRLKQARAFATRFHGVVYSYISLARLGAADAELAAVSKPDRLAELDDKSLDRVITVSRKMMGAVPWRGGTLRLEIGLFSIRTGDLLTPVVDYVTKVSTTAGASFVGAVKPFLPLITEGLDLLAGQRGDSAIEVALDTDIGVTAGGVHAIIAAPKGTIDTAKLSLDADDRKLLLGGRPLGEAYCVFSIRPTRQRADFGEIPELKERYAAFQASIAANRMRDAQDALTAFRLATIASPDLITSDAQALSRKAEERLKLAFPAGGISDDRTRQRVAEPLSAIGLYD